MENIKTLNCPNCGAATTNIRNCEYCNSLLVRFMDKGIEIDSPSYGKEAKMFSGLVDVLEIMLSRIKKGHKTCCDVYIKGTDELDCQAAHLVNSQGDKNGITLQIEYLKNSSFDLDFQKEAMFSLFSSTEKKLGNNIFSSYWIDFGEDCIGASRIVSRVLTEIDNIPINNTLEFDIYDEKFYDNYQGFRKCYRAGKSEPIHLIPVLTFCPDPTIEENISYDIIERENTNNSWLSYLGEYWWIIAGVIIGLFLIKSCG